MSKSIFRRVIFTRLWLFAFLLELILGPLPTPPATKAQSLRPNFLIIMTDDQSHDTLTDQFMPNTKSMIADEGISFTRGYMSSALCCPSRSSFLTGKYARHHGVHLNGDQLDQVTIANRLQQEGYYTGLVGKYLNSWPGDSRPEYNYWACHTSAYINPTFNLAGNSQVVPGYLTYLLRDYAVDFLNQIPDDRPFFLMFTPHAPHAPATPAPGDETLYSDLPPWRPPNFNPPPSPGEPTWLQERTPLTPAEIAENDEFRLDQLRTLHPVDVAVRDILNKLREQGKLDNTLVVFCSDNGWFWGEHRLSKKNRAYEEASHGPFALRYPPLVKTPHVENRLIQMIDLAPTMYELAGITIPSDVDGKSLVPLMRGTLEWRDSILLEGWHRSILDEQKAEDAPAINDVTAALPRAHYQAIRTEQYVYIETDNDTPELYDTVADPYELNNLVKKKKYKKLVKELKMRLHQELF